MSSILSISKGYLLVFASLCSWCCLAVEVENVRSYRAPDYTRLVFDLSGPADHQLFTLDNPDRVVVDVSKANMRADLANLELDDTPITNIRSAPRNQKDIRVVFDLKTKTQARSFLLSSNQQYGDRLVIDFLDTDAKGSPPQSKPVISAEELNQGQRDIIVAISAGHGGEDPGAVGVDRIQEKRVVLAISREMEALINATPGYKAVMVRDGDYGMKLKQRTHIAHANNADFFIAIHADSFKNSSARGATVYALSQKGATSEHARLLAEKENAADLMGGVGTISLDDKDEVLRSVLLDLSMTASISASLEAGTKILSSISDVTRLRRKRVEQANFVVLRSADIPSLLIESGYITNPTDAQNLNSAWFQRQFAQALVNGITAYFLEAPPRGSWISWNKENGGAPGSYVVSRGDTISEIANRFRVSAAAIKSANGLTSNNIQVGQKLIIPNQIISANAISMVQHKIKRGETLSGIAQRYSIPVQRLRDTNALNNDMLRIGQVLKIPSS